MALHEQLPFFNPTVPFCSPIPGGLLEGMSITVCGRVFPDANRFHVDLQNAADVALHFNPRYNSGGYIVHNSRLNGVWGNEENKAPTPFPRGHLFTLQILITLSSYKISANGKPFSEFKHRMPLTHVDKICMAGMVRPSLIAFQYLEPDHPVPPASLKVPYKSIIDGGLRSGKVIIIEGVINPDGMEIFLRHKTGIAFYYSPRFDENVVVCNSYEDGTWGDEEIYELMPIEIGQPLQVTIFCSHQGYEVFVNGEQTHTYSHRYTNLEEIDVLDIRGDVQLSFVQP
ncbi:galectin-9-like [Sinocyclocheilus anshuiensis]|uniref:galectin-9-like n=1 Tax=Sinocyclocheilus anshuiensis TaxID=1608454 RepID=UPI0007B9BC58|nr:PREDICTED: galectin-9-like [Sinocyclocheilus anshuiensis]